MTLYIFNDISLSFNYLCIFRFTVLRTLLILFHLLYFCLKLINTIDIMLDIELMLFLFPISITLFSLYPPQLLLQPPILLLNFLNIFLQLISQYLRFRKFLFHNFYLHFYLHTITLTNLNSPYLI
jgi:hypothetical protein